MYHICSIFVYFFQKIGIFISINMDVIHMDETINIVNKRIGHSWNSGQSASTIIAIPREMADKYQMKNSDILFEDTGTGILVKKLEI